MPGSGTIAAIHGSSLGTVLKLISVTGALALEYLITNVELCC